MRGTVDKRPGSDEANLIVNEIMALEDLESRYTRGVSIRLLEAEHGLVKLEQLHEILRGYPGNYPLELTLCLADGSRVPCAVPTFAWRLLRRCAPASRSYWAPAISVCKPPVAAMDGAGRGECRAGGKTGSEAKGR